MSESKDQTDLSKAIEIINRSRTICQQMGNEYWMPEHLLVSLLSERSVKIAIFEVTREEEIIKDIGEAVLENLSALPRFRDGGPAIKSDAITKIVDIMVADTEFSGKAKATALDVLIALMKDKDSTAYRILRENNVDVVDIQEYQAANEDTEASEEAEAAAEELPAHVKILNKYCVNLNERVKKKTIDPLIGRTKEIDEMILALARRYKKNAMLLGHPGVGKTAIAEGMAHKINEGDVPEILQNAEVWALDVTAVLAGAKFRGDMEDRMKNIIKALGKIDNPILFIDEIHMVMGAGGGQNSAMDMANIMKPALARGEFRCIGATTDEEYRKYFEEDKAMDRRFMKIRVEEPSIEDAIEILKGIAPSYEEFHGVVYEEGAVEAMVRASARYITNRYLPDKAIDVMDISGAARKIRNSITGDNDPITVLDIQKEIASMAGVPVETVSESETEKLATLEEDLGKAVFDQTKAVTALSNAVLLARSGLRAPTMTLGNYLMVGPSGSGKTEICKQMSKTMGIKLIRYDMSEFMEAHSVSKLIGSPPGYVGYNDGSAGAGMLINDIEENPYSILLLDEIEKAHPDVFNLFLQVMDNGTLTSSSGKEVNCRNMFVIMTSNAGAEDAARDAVGFGRTTREGSIMKAVEKAFSPEFRNRLDSIIEFNVLGRDTVLKIVDKFMREFNILSVEKNVVVTLDEDVKNVLAERGYDPKMGARPLARVINEQIKLPISKMMLFGDLRNGGIVNVKMNGEEFVFDVVGSFSEVEAQKVIEA